MNAFRILSLLLILSAQAHANLYSKRVYVVNGIAFAEEVNLVDGKAVTTTTRLQDGAPIPNTNGLVPVQPAIIAPPVGSAQPAYPAAYILPPNMAYPKEAQDAYRNPNLPTHLAIDPNQNTATHSVSGVNENGDGKPLY